MSQPDREEQITAVEITIQACARLMIGTVLDLLQADPHSWSDRPCPTCKPISTIVGREFGCYLYAKNRRRATSKG